MERTLFSMLSCCRLFSVLQVLSFCELLAMLGEVLVMQLPLSHFCSLPSPLSQYHSLFTKMELGGICTLVCREVPVWDEQMLGFCHTHLVNSVFCLPVPIPTHSTLPCCRVSCPKSCHTILKVNGPPKRAESDRKPCFAKEGRTG